MQIHELNNYSGSLGDAYLVADNGSDTGKMKTTALTDPLNARIDNIIAGGAAPSASEIVDARLGANGVTYPSLGAAIRNQVSSIDSSVGQLSYIQTTWDNGHYINSLGAVGTAANYQASDFIKLKETDSIKYNVRYSVKASNAVYIAFYDAERNYIANSAFKIGATSTDEVVNGVLTPPPHAVYVRLTNAVTYNPVLMIQDLEAESDIIKEISNNFDLTTITEHSFINPNNGEFVSPSSNYGYYVSDYIPVESGKMYTFIKANDTAFGTGGGVKLPAYNNEKTFIQTLICTVKSSAHVVNANIYQIDIPNGVEYIRLTIPNAIVAPMCLEGEAYYDKYYPYGSTDVLSDKMIVATRNTPAKPNNPLYEKTAVFDGDSICEAVYGDGGWAKRIGDNNNMTWHNYGVSGGTITENVLNSQSQLLHSVCTNLAQLHTDYPDADYIILEGGTNDNAEIGSILNGNVPERFGTYNLTDYSGNYDGDTFCGAVEKMFYNAINWWTGKKIGFIIAHKMTPSNVGYTKETNNKRAYFDVIIKLCEKWGIPYLNLWDGCYLNPSLPSCYNSDLTPAENRESGYPIYDGQHLSNTGYDYITPIIESWMRTL